MSREFIEKYLQETVEITQKIDREEINAFIKILFEAWKQGKKIITMGNGGSASTASHFASDLSKTVVNPSSEKDITGKKGFRALCLNDNPALLTAWINDCGWDKAYAGALTTLLDDGDVILLISVHGGSGWSSNIIQAIGTARKKNAKVLGLAGFNGGKLKEMADACIVVPKDSTPHTEGFHSVLQHMIVQRLQDIISSSPEDSIISRLQEISKKYSDPLLKQNIEEIIKEFS